MTINDLNKLKPQLAYFVLSVPIHISHFFVNQISEFAYESVKSKKLNKRNT